MTMMNDDDNDDDDDDDENDDDNDENVKKWKNQLNQTRDNFCSNNPFGSWDG